MVRRSRMYLAGMPYHIVQRGNNREACFHGADDYVYYLSLWEGLSARYKLSVHAYCLMTNHIHFLVTPSTDQGISKTMQVVGSRYGFYFNKRYRRTGTVWEGRHSSSAIQSDRYLFACYRYIELNPVRANMVNSPGDYPWSSYSANAWGQRSWVAGHEEYNSLGESPSERQQAYRAIFHDVVKNHSVSEIRSSIRYNFPLGDDRFRKQIEDKLGRPIGYDKRGRPPKPIA